MQNATPDGHLSSSYHPACDSSVRVETRRFSLHRIALPYPQPSPLPTLSMLHRAPYSFHGTVGYGATKNKLQSDRKRISHNVHLSRQLALRVTPLRRHVTSKEETFTLQTISWIIRLKRDIEGLI